MNTGRANVIEKGYKEPFPAVYPPRLIQCPTCGHEQSLEVTYAPCMCHRCGARICEDYITEAEMIDWHAFEQGTEATAMYPHANEGNGYEASYIGLGLAGEFGELADCMKKLYRLEWLYKQGKIEEGEYQEKRQKIEDKAFLEAGDGLWYLARAMKFFGWDMRDVLKANQGKLQERLEKDEIAFREDK